MQVQLRLQAEAAACRWATASPPCRPPCALNTSGRCGTLHDQAEPFRQRVEAGASGRAAVLATLGSLRRPRTGPALPATPATPGPVPGSAGALAAPALELLVDDADAEPEADPGVVVRDVGIRGPRVLETQGGRSRTCRRRSRGGRHRLRSRTARRRARRRSSCASQADIEARAAGAIDGPSSRSGWRSSNTRWGRFVAPPHPARSAGVNPLACSPLADLLGGRASGECEAAARAVTRASVPSVAANSRKPPGSRAGSGRPRTASPRAPWPAPPPPRSSRAAPRRRRRPEVADGEGQVKTPLSCALISGHRLGRAEEARHGSGAAKSMGTASARS